MSSLVVLPWLQQTLVFAFPALLSFLHGLVADVGLLAGSHTYHSRYKRYL
jgi:hypothetical protein